MNVIHSKHAYYLKKYIVCKGDNRNRKVFCLIGSINMLTEFHGNLHEHMGILP